jgi:hypothetical protein
MTHNGKDVSAVAEAYVPVVGVKIYCSIAFQ